MSNCVALIMMCEEGLLLEQLRNAARSSLCSESRSYTEPGRPRAAAYWQGELMSHRANCKICSVVLKVPELSACPTLELLIEWRDRTQRVVECLFSEVGDARVLAFDDTRRKQALHMLMFWERQITNHIKICAECATRSAL
jgi:hypothetical protein